MVVFRHRGNKPLLATRLPAFNLEWLTDGADSLG